MSETESDKDLPMRLSFPDSFSEEFVDKNEATLRRSENVQILIALGFLGLAGTFVAQNLITFPLLERASDSELVLWGFRLLVYATVVFLTAKLITSTFYPGSGNRVLIAVHEWIEPFIYVFSTSSFGILVAIVMLIQNTPLSLGNMLVILIVLLTSLPLAIAYSNRRSNVYERMRDAETQEIEIKLLWNLFTEEAWSSGMEEEKLIDWSSPNESEKRVRAVLEEMLSDEDSLVKRDGEEIKLTGKYDTVEVLKRYGIPETELRTIISDYTKSTPTANPDSDDETIFYCHYCKKRFAESEMSPLQIENQECPECAGKLDLHASPRDHRRR